VLSSPPSLAFLHSNGHSEAMKRALRSRHVGDSDVIRGELTPADLLFGGKEYVVSLPVLARRAVGWSNGHRR